MEQVNQLVTENVFMIYDILKRMNLISQINEYYDICLIGLCKAAKYYKKEKNYAFSTFAYNIIKNEILHSIKYKNSSKEKANINAISFQDVLYYNQEGEETTLQDLISSDFDVEECILKEELITELREAINELNDRDKYIICSVYGLYGYNELTNQQIGKDLHISKVYVSRLKYKIIDKLKKKLKEDK